MIALVTSEAKHALFENVVLFVPKGKGNTGELVVVRDTSNAVFSPAVGSGSGVGVREVAPGVAICRVVFSYCGLLIPLER